MEMVKSLSRPEFKKVQSCPLCGSAPQSWNLYAESFGAVPFEKELFSIYRCNQCGLGITDPVPSEDDSHLLYQERTSCDFQGDDSTAAASLKRAIADRDTRAFVNGTRTTQSSLKMLDYACGNGSFALSMQRLFPNSTVFATDYHTEAPPMLKGSNVRYTGYAGLSDHGPFDFILCRHVLEHTYKPVEFLRTMGGLLRSGGVLMIEVPNQEAPFRKVFGKYWDGHYVPFHPIHFSKAALRQAVVDSGLTVEKEGGAEMPKVGRSLRNWIGCKYNAALFVSGVLLHPLQVAAGVVAGEPTCLRLWGRKS